MVSNMDHISEVGPLGSALNQYLSRYFPNYIDIKPEDAAELNKANDLLTLSYPHLIDQGVTRASWLAHGNGCFAQYTQFSSKNAQSENPSELASLINQDLNLVMMHDWNQGELVMSGYVRDGRAFAIEFSNEKSAPCDRRTITEQIEELHYSLGIIEKYFHAPNFIPARS